MRKVRIETKGGRTTVTDARTKKEIEGLEGWIVKWEEGMAEPICKLRLRDNVTEVAKATFAYEGEAEEEE